MGWNSSHFNIMTALVTISVEEVGKSAFITQVSSALTMETYWCLFVESFTISAGSLDPAVLQGITPSRYSRSEIQFHFKQVLNLSKRCFLGASCFKSSWILLVGSQGEPTKHSPGLSCSGSWSSYLLSCGACEILFFANGFDSASN